MGHKVMTFLNTILSRLEEIIVTVALAVGAVLTFIEVVLRYGFGASLAFTHELVIYLLILTGFIGSSIGVREKTHIGVDIVVQHLPSVKLQKIVVVGGLTVCALFCVIIAYLGVQHVIILFNLGQVTPEMEIPVYIPKAIVPLAFSLMTLRFIQEFIKYIRIPAKDIFGGKRV